MQTFLPFDDFKRSAHCLDYRRLGKQRVEARQIITVLETGVGAWSNHPAVLMWKGFEDSLKVYHNVVIAEWIGRGYKNNMPFFDVELGWYYPDWFGEPLFHRSHIMNLLRKDYSYYIRFFPGYKIYSRELINSYSYWWPTKELEEIK